MNEGFWSSLGWLEDLEEEEWVDGWWPLNVDIRRKKISFNVGRNWENDEEMLSCELSLSSSVLEFECLFLKTKEMELNLDLFR